MNKFLVSLFVVSACCGMLATLPVGQDIVVYAQDILVDPPLVGDYPMPDGEEGSWWSGLSGWEKGAIIVGGVVIVAGGIVALVAWALGISIWAAIALVALTIAEFLKAVAVLFGQVLLLILVSISDFLILVRHGIGIIVSAVFIYIKRRWKRIVKWFKKNWRWLARKILGEAIQLLIEKLIRDAIDWIKENVEWIKKKLIQAGEWVVEKAKKAKRWIGSQARKAKKAISNGWKKVKKKLGFGPPAPCQPRTFTVGPMTAEFTETERDFAGGMTGAEVEQSAIDLAEEQAIEKLKKKLMAEANKQPCMGDCKRSYQFDIHIVGTTEADEPDRGWIWDSYTATATAEGTLTVKCEQK